MGLFDFLFRNKKRCETAEICGDCGELIQNCKCEKGGQGKTNKKLVSKHENDDFDDLEFDEMNDVWDELDGI